MNPALVIRFGLYFTKTTGHRHVLSPTTKNYDRGDKFLHYRSIPSLQDYLLIDSESIHVEHYQRQDDNGWLLHEHQDMEAQLYLKSIDQTLKLANIYAQISFENS